MNRLLILVANEPRSYREVMSAALAELRPDAQVLTVEPESLDAEVRRGVAGVVLCSRLTPAVERGALAWIELYPEGRSEVRIGLDGLRLTAPEGLTLPDLLWFVDRAVSLGNTPNGHHRRKGRRGKRSRQP